MFFVCLLFVLSTLHVHADNGPQPVNPLGAKYGKTAYLRLKDVPGDRNFHKDVGVRRDELYYDKGSSGFDAMRQSDSPYIVQVEDINKSVPSAKQQYIAAVVASDVAARATLGTAASAPSKAKQEPQKLIENGKPVSEKKDINDQTMLNSTAAKQEAVKLTAEADKASLATKEGAQKKSLPHPSDLFSGSGSFISRLKISDEQVVARPNGPYKGFFASFMLAGTSSLDGNEERPNTVNNTGSQTASNGWIRYDTFSARKTYLPSVELGIFVGWQVSPRIRAHLDFSWTYMHGIIGSLQSNAQGSPGAHFVLPSNFLNGHLLVSTMNVFFDPYQNLQIWPTIGAGAGLAYFVTSGESNNALMWPVFNVYLGLNYMLPDNKTIISFGYKMQYMYTGTSDNIRPITDLSGLYQDGRPTNRDESVFTSLLVHKLELAIRFY